MELLIIALVFVMITIGVVYLSTTEALQGVKTKIISLVTVIAGLLQANLPGLVGDLMTPTGVAWIFVGLGITTLVAKHVSR
ncbi:MAG: hypothetical protein GXP16_12055 [Gammaproteobacteria bacterium]|nr:hypothetical protein [Gammaproteobacteria bacterium]